jgi:hypothetical protein
MDDARENLPAIFKPDEVAKHFGWSVRRLREKAREIGACRLLGNKMVMTTSDIEALMEATRPKASRLGSPIPSPIEQRSSNSARLKIPIRENDAYEAAMQLATRKKSRS